MSFYTTRVQALIWGKNITIAVLAGEMFPLDLLPEPFRHIALASPFASAAYIPVAYVTGRIESPQAWQALYVVCMYAVAIGALAAFGWRRAIKNYTGVGA